MHKSQICLDYYSNSAQHLFDMMFIHHSYALIYNFNSEVYMLHKILTKRLITNRNIVYFFGKDPFQKFNRKKDPKNQEDNKAKSPEKSKTIKNEKLAGFKFDDKHKKAFQTKLNQKIDKEQQTHHSGFEKFGNKSRHSPKHEEETNKQPQIPQEKQHPINSFEKSNQEENIKQQHEKKQEEGRQFFKEENSSTTLKGFEKFNRNKSPSQRPKSKSKQPEVNKQSPEQPKLQVKNEEKKKSQIPNINVDLNSEPNDEKTTPLRKPKGYKQKKQTQQSQTTETINSIKSDESTDNAHQQAPKVQKKPEQIDNNIWQEFEQKIKETKASHNKSLPRYERLNLLKDQQTNEKKKNEQKSSEEPPDIKKQLTKLVIAGIGLIMLSNNDYFKWSVGKEVDPQYLKTAIEEDRIDQTWVQNVESDLNNDESIKGKSAKSLVYIRQKNGDVSYCTSNLQFEKIWFSLVDKHNQLIEKKATEAFPMAGQSDPMLKGSQAVRKIALRPRQDQKNSSLVADTRSILSMVLLYFFIKSIMSVGKGTKNKEGKISGLFEDEKSHRFKQAIKITFQDVVGMQKAKDEIVEFIDFLKHPQKYNKLGARIPKGALLTGPPGTGKTMIAKACAGESKVPFYTISGSQFIEMYVGVGAQRVRNLFQQAKENAPSIIFIDEIDAVGKKRSGLGGGGNDERDTTLNQLLVQMDGFNTETNVIVFAATNQKEVLDPALTRPGRFDRMIQIDLPDLEGRREIFQVHLKPLVLDDRIDIKDYARRLATLTPGFSGADIKNVCNEAAIIAARNNKQKVSIIDFELATERIIGGVEKRSQLITPETRKTVAYHQCGHGVVSWFIENANPLLKLTIIPRSKGALGFAQYLPNEHQMYTKVKMLDEICVILGGRISEEIFFGKISTGASDDLNKAYQIAKAYVTEYGFGDKLGWIQYTQTQYAKEYSKEVENKIDAEILEIMKSCSERTRNIVHQKKELIHKLAEKLLELETIDQNIITGILGERPFKMSKQHEEYIKEKKRISEEILGAKSEGTTNLAQMKRSDYVV